MPCSGNFLFYIRDCYGVVHFVTPSTPVSCICMATGCCVDAFVVQDVNHCWVIKLDPATCASC